MSRQADFGRAPAGTLPTPAAPASAPLAHADSHAPAGLDPIYMGFARPSDYGWKSWTNDPLVSSTTGVITSGTLYLTHHRVPVAGTISNIVIFITVAGAALTSGQSKVALYDEAGNLLGVSADQSTSWTSTGLKTIALTTPVTVTSGQTVWAGIWSVGTTPPSIVRTVAQSALILSGNATFIRGATADTGLTTTAPAVFGTKVNAGTLYWMALS